MLFAKNNRTGRWKHKANWRFKSTIMFLLFILLWIESLFTIRFPSNIFDHLHENLFFLDLFRRLILFSLETYLFFMVPTALTKPITTFKGFPFIACKNSYLFYFFLGHFFLKSRIHLYFSVYFCLTRKKKNKKYIVNRLHLCIFLNPWKMNIPFKTLVENLALAKILFETLK